ncbi:cyclin-like protein [Diplogelasinospora grovesii]|uniref:Cyclin-like protein n=1 Tax=Diplogelasinospora grovesii TaxID=303347 RepID=A0AAN6MWH4_9PEZI|nr:cyclin-like protein [Diplogelasinospora grovesii]
MTFIFSEDVDSNANTRSNASPKSDISASKMATQVKNPRHFKSQPVLRTEQQPGLRCTQRGHEENVTKAPYQDALEKLAALLTLTDRLQVNPVAPPGQEAAFSQQINIEPRPQLPQVCETAGHRIEQDAVSVITQPDDNWDEDEGDMYDDQGYKSAYSSLSHGDSTTAGVRTMLAPKVTRKVQTELEIAKRVVEATTTAEQIEEEWDTSLMAEYSDEIFNYMRELETTLAPHPHYMDIQTVVSWSMRSVLMDWLIQVHNRFGLLPETLFLTVNYIDRFLSVKVVPLSKLKLVGTTALFIAAKYEERNCLSIQTIVNIGNGSLTIEEILKAERFMLSMLDFELGWPGPMSFLRRISKADYYEIETRTLAKYFLEVTIMDERFVGSPPSYIAAGAYCLARMMLRKGDWTAAHTHYAGYTLSQIQPLMSLIFDCCSDQMMHHRAVYDKYQGSQFKHAAVFVQTEINKGFKVFPGQSY